MEQHKIFISWEYSSKLIIKFCFGTSLLSGGKRGKLWILKAKLQLNTGNQQNYLLLLLFIIYKMLYYYGYIYTNN